MRENNWKKKKNRASRTPGQYQKSDTCIIKYLLGKEKEMVRKKKNLKK